MEQTRKPPKRDTRKVLWQGKYLDGFLLIELLAATKIKGTLYLTEMQFTLDADLDSDLIKTVSPRYIVDCFLDRFEKEYKEAECERCREGVAHGSITLQ